MKASRVRRLVAVIPAIGVLSCAGDEPTNNEGIVHISAATLAPLIIGCGTTLTNPPKNIAGPDTLLFQLRMVNTTANDVYVTGAGAFGAVTVSTDPLDVGNSTANFSSIPFTPSPALLAARYGDLSIRVSVPMDPVCQTKPLFYSGEQEVILRARMTTTSGQYETVWATIKVIWS